MKTIKIYAGHIESPILEFTVKFHHSAYRPHGHPYTIPADYRIVTVLAQTEEGALKIAEFHYPRFGSEFEIVSPSVACGNVKLEQKHNVKLKKVCQVCGHAHNRPGHEKEDSQACLDMAATQATIDYASLNWE